MVSIHQLDVFLHHIHDHSVVQDCFLPRHADDGGGCFFCWYNFNRDCLPRNTPFVVFSVRKENLRITLVFYGERTGAELTKNLISYSEDELFTNPIG